MARLTHFDEEGRARMVDVSAKQETLREAVAAGAVYANAETLRLIAHREIAKGDVLAVARLAGIMAAKRTAEFIPLCHPLPLTSVEVDLRLESDHVAIEARVQTVGRTGVEMEALTAVSIAALTVYDMCKAVDRAMEIGKIRLLKKTGGKSGTFLREDH